MMTLKWLMIPLVAAFIGFKLIGPMIAGSKPDSSQAAAVKRVLPQSEKGKKFQSVREGNNP